MCERQERSHERRGEEMKGDEKRREPRRAEKREANKNLRLWQNMEREERREEKRCKRAEMTMANLSICTYMIHIKTYMLRREGKERWEKRCHTAECQDSNLPCLPDACCILVTKTVPMMDIIFSCGSFKYISFSIILVSSKYKSVLQNFILFDLATMIHNEYNNACLKQYNIYRHEISGNSNNYSKHDLTRYAISHIAMM